MATLPLLATPFLVFILSLLACRPQVRRMTLGGLAILGIFALTGGWLCIDYSGGVLSRFDAPETLRRATHFQHVQQRESRLLEKGLKHYASVRIAGVPGASVLKPTTPSELKIGNTNIVPNYPWEDRGNSAFRKDWLGQNSISTTQSPEQTMLRWYKYGREQLGVLEQAQAARRNRMYPVLELMASSKWRFDLKAARRMTSLALAGEASIVAADLLGDIWEWRFFGRFADDRGT